MKKILKADSGKPLQGGELCPSGRSLWGECVRSPVIEDKAAEWSSLHDVRLDLARQGPARRKGTGKCQVPFQTPPGGFRAFFSPSFHPTPSPCQLSAHPSAGPPQGGRWHRGSCWSGSKCPVRWTWGRVFSMSSAELFLCSTVISDPWDPLGMPRTIS